MSQSSCNGNETNSILNSKIIKNFDEIKFFENEL